VGVGRVANAHAVANRKILVGKRRRFSLVLVAFFGELFGAHLGVRTGVKVDLRRDGVLLGHTADHVVANAVLLDGHGGQERLAGLEF